jgi:membrane-bound serine protease (ClpP class)
VDPTVESGPVRRRLPFVLAFAVSLMAAPAWAQSASPPAVPPGERLATVDIVKVHGIVDPTVSGFVTDELRDAEARGSTVILQLDAGGSFDDFGPALGRTILRTRVPVVTWVGPIGARLEGGAAFLAYSSGLVAMAPGAGIGPARPFDAETTAAAEPPAEVAAQTAALTEVAAGAGVPASAVTAVTNRALPAGPALDAGAVSVVAANVTDLLESLDGRTVRTGAGPATLSTVTSSGHPLTVRFVEPGPVDRFLHAISTPTAVYVLVVLGIWGIAFELTQPAFGVAGIAGGLALAAAAYGLTVVPVLWFGFLVLLAGMALQWLDVVLRRLAWLTAIGTVLFALGSWLAWRGVAPSIDLSWWLVALFTVAGLLFFGFGLTVAMRSREQIRTAQVGLVGLVGEVRSDLNPEGGVYVKGTLWRARSMNGHIPKGTRVRVRGIDGLILRVQEEDDPGAPG